MAKTNFPRVGAWVVITATNALGIIAALGHQDTMAVEEPNPNAAPGQATTHIVSRPITTPADEAEIHLVNLNPDPTADPAETLGDFLRKLKNVPFANFRQATLAEIRQLGDRTAGVDELYASERGYGLTDEEAARVPSLRAARDVRMARESEVSAHPDVVSFGADIARRRAEFEEGVERERVALLSRVAPDLVSTSTASTAQQS